MKIKFCLFLLLSCLSITSYAQKNIVSDLIENIIEKHLPYSLYEHKNKQWEMGVYNLKIERLGKSTFDSTNTQINLAFPVKAMLDGQIKQKLLGTNINIACKGEFTTKTTIKITPVIKVENSNAKVKIVFSVPPTNLECEGITIPIQAVLTTLIQQKIKTWEQDIAANLNNLFTQAGI